VAAPEACVDFAALQDRLAQPGSPIPIPPPAQGGKPQESCSESEASRLVLEKEGDRAP
jgi:hypothetical protein